MGLKWGIGVAERQKVNVLEMKYFGWNTGGMKTKGQ